MKGNPNLITGQHAITVARYPFFRRDEHVPILR